MNEDTVGLMLQIDSGGGSRAALDRLSTVLMGELCAARIGRVARSTAEAEHGSKSGVVPVLGDLTVNGVAASAAALLYKTLMGFLDRSKARSVTVKLGDAEIVVNAATKNEVAEALALAMKHAADANKPEHDG
ncbi:antitoxin component of MazEF toxin-antitoxin module [Amycolatopsis lexingtonensis]|uniref:Antitoxin component of MazEF toxin-antitoxin module n=1 Tax=Amycolatopsis lexingtonensis TaxID=218822 RepID=A0ABR9HZB4_9PSEU|nr:hypothetical protein [Amycolatopsis lexingtonensis]MBE1496263.1 antitoxin component of MazEF toxin-antitoxin module [Amycolatopsis lexingtonensis]